MGKRILKQAVDATSQKWPVVFLRPFLRKVVDGMGEMMSFPETPEEFLEQYSFVDKKGEYTNGSELIPVFRVKQMLEHYFQE